jgi:hypothetical protein
MGDLEDMIARGIIKKPDGYVNTERGRFSVYGFTVCKVDRFGMPKRRVGIVEDGVAYGEGMDRETIVLGKVDYGIVD